MLEGISAWATAWGQWFSANWPHDWNSLFGILEALGGWALTDPIIRTVALAALIYFTLRLIASVYGGDIQNGQIGPVAFRPHPGNRLGRTDIRLPKTLMPLSMEGVRASFEVHYVFTDKDGGRRSILLHTVRNAKIHVSPVALPNVASVVTGQEITQSIGALSPEDVVLPAGDAETAPDTIRPTAQTVADYVRENRVLEAWTEDDSAQRVAIQSGLLEQIKDLRDNYIESRAERLRRMRVGAFFQRWLAKRLARSRPGVVGSYYLKFKLSRDPFFILSRHPDRDLKMTAWLTVLTSVFAMVMEAWPLRMEQARAATVTSEHASEAPRIPRGPATP
jgi:hypothetical protein